MSGVERYPRNRDREAAEREGMRSGPRGPERGGASKPKASHPVLEFRDAVQAFGARHRTGCGIALIALLCLVLAGCWILGRDYDARRATARPTITNDADRDADNSFLMPTDMDLRTDSESLVDMDLGAMSEDVLISKEGDYRLFGKYRGTIIVDAPEQNVHLFLDGVDITAKKGPAVLVRNGNKVVFTLTGENKISDNGDYRGMEYDACIYSGVSLTFNGTGSLSLSGLYKDGLRSKDVIKILGGNYRLTCKRTGIHGNDGIYVNGGDFFISTEKNGLKTTKSGGMGKGNLMVTGGSMNIIAGRFAFVVEKADLFIYDCSIRTMATAGNYSLGGKQYIEPGCVQ